MSVSSYCLFLYICFVDFKGPGNPCLNFRDLEGRFLPCPTTCNCYDAPEKRFGPTNTSNSMVCTRTIEEFSLLQYTNSSSHPFLHPRFNTITLKDMDRLERPSITLNAQNVVFDNVANITAVLTFNTNYLTFLNMDELPVLPQKSRQIKGFHIENFHFKNAVFQPDIDGRALDYSNLRSFNIRKTNLELIIASKFFPTSRRLHTIDLSNNHLINIESIYYKQTPKSSVQELDLSNNRLTSIPKDLKIAFPRLRRLHLAMNLLKTINMNDIRPLSTIHEFILYASVNENPAIYDYVMGNSSSKQKSLEEELLLAK